MKLPLICLSFCLLSLFGCAPFSEDTPALQTVEVVDLNRYLGTWYEIARYPHRFQKDCVATKAIYTMREDGLIDVYNECREKSVDGPLKSARGKARVVDQRTNAKLEVSFFWPFWGDYWIIDLAPSYRWAVVGHPSRKYLWVLSRDPIMSEKVFLAIQKRLVEQGYALEPLMMTPQVQSQQM